MRRLAVTGVVGAAVAIFLLQGLTAPRARRQRKRRPPPPKAVAWRSVKCGKILGRARATEVLKFDKLELKLAAVRTIVVEYKYRFLKPQPTGRCCEVKVTTQSAVQKKGGKRVLFDGSASLRIEVGKGTQQCPIVGKTEVAQSYKCFAYDFKTCPKGSQSKLDILLMVF